MHTETVVRKSETCGRCGFSESTQEQSNMGSVAKPELGIAVKQCVGVRLRYVFAVYAGVILDLYAWLEGRKHQCQQEGPL